MNPSPLISVIMPCYNAELYLREAIESIINQTYAHFELIAIDDGSTDSTLSILEEYTAKDKRIRLIRNGENIKLIRTLNKGIELANGEYIARMDADDISVLNRFEIQLKYMQAHPDIDIVSTGYIIINEQGAVIARSIPRQHYPESCFYASFYYVPVGHPELLIRTKVLKDNPFLFEDHVLHTEDYELWSRLVRKHYRLSNIDDCLLYFRINPQSVSRKYTTIQDENFVKCARLHYQDFTKKEFSSEIISILVNRIHHNPKIGIFRTGIREMKEFKHYFIEKEGIVNKEILKEIKIVYYTHLFDICYQTFKKSRGRTQLFSLWILLINFQIFLNKNVLIYLRNKVQKF